MKKRLSGLLAVIAGALGLSTSAHAGVFFTPGDVVVYRVGDGTGSLLNTGNAVFLDEYTSAGVLVHSLAMPTTSSGANRALIASGTAGSEGLLTLSTDSRYLFLTGYNAPIPTTGLAGTASATVSRTVGRIDSSGTIDTTTALTDFADANNPRSVISTDGTNIWVAGGSGGIRYTTLGSTTSTQVNTAGTPVTNIKQVNIFGGQLYASTSSGSTFHLGTVGTGLPTTSGQATTNLPGYPVTGNSPYNFFLADLSPAVAGLDTLYVSDDTTGASGILKYSLVGGTWTLNGTITALSARGLIASVSGSSVSLFATTGGGNATGGGSLYSFTDTTGYNGAVSGTATTLAVADSNEAFRGVALVPTPEPTSIALLLPTGLLLLARRRRQA